MLQNVQNNKLQLKLFFDFVWKRAKPYSVSQKTKAAGMNLCVQSWLGDDLVFGLFARNVLFLNSSGWYLSFEVKLMGILLMFVIHSDVWATPGVLKRQEEQHITGASHWSCVSFNSLPSWLCVRCQLLTLPAVYSTNSNQPLFSAPSHVGLVKASSSPKCTCVADCDDWLFCTVHSWNSSNFISCIRNTVDL